MKLTLERAYYKDAPLKKKILIVVFCSVIYFVIRYLFDAPLISLTLGKISPSKALNPIFGILFGWPGVISVCIGTFARLCLFPSEVILQYLPQVISSGIMSAAAYIVFHQMSSGEKKIYILNNYVRVFRYTAATISGAIAGVAFTFLIDVISIPSSILYELYLVPGMLLDAIDMGMILGMPLFIHLSRTNKLVKDSLGQAKGLSTTERIVLIFGVMEIVIFIFVVFKEYFTSFTETTFTYLISSYTIAAITDNILLVMMLFIIFSSYNKEAILRAAEKFGFFLLLAGVVYGVRIIVNERILMHSVIASVNMIEGITIILICAVVVFGLMLDRHTITKQSVLFFSLVLLLGLICAADLSVTAYSVITNELPLAAFFDFISTILYGAYLIIALEYAFETINVSNEKQRPPRLVWMVTVTIFTGAYFLNSWLDVSWISIVYLCSAILALGWFSWYVNKHSDNKYETISLISLIVLSMIVSVIERSVEGLYVYTAGGLCGLFLCFANIYVKRSNSLSATQADLELASSIQLNMLPTNFNLPELDTIDLYASMRPAKDVGGDFYDFYRISRKHIAFVVADVSGKGPSGAMMMMRAITSIKNFARAGLPVDRLMEMASNNINDHNDEMLFVTAWMGILNLETGKLVFVNAGHTPPVLKHADGSVEEIFTKPDMIMGFFPNAKYTKQTMTLQPGDSIYLYTDGITEAFSDANEQFGVERLKKVLSLEYESSMELCKKVVSSVDEFVGAATQFDDMTMLAIKYKGPNDHLTENYLYDKFESSNDVLDEDTTEPVFRGLIAFEESRNDEPIEIELI